MNEDGFKYDGSETDRDRAIESFYQWGAWELAEDLYEARYLARILLRDMAGCEPKGLPYWAQP